MTDVKDLKRNITALEMEVEIKALHDKLVAASNKYTGDNGANDRESAQDALYAMIELQTSLVRMRLLPPESSLPLASLYAAIADVEAGRNPPLLTPIRASGAPLMPKVEAVRMVLVSAAISYLMQLEHSEEKAARLVGRLMEKHSLPMPKGRATQNWKKLTNYRDKLRQYEYGKPAFRLHDTHLVQFIMHSRIHEEWQDERVIEEIFMGLNLK
jgi:hypothetical protein